MHPSNGPKPSRPLSEVPVLWVSPRSDTHIPRDLAETFLLVVLQPAVY